MQPALHRCVTMIGMDEFEPSTVREALRRVTEIFHRPLIQVIQLASGSTAPDECRNGIYEKAKLPLTLTQRLFRLFSLVDVRQQHAPANDLSSRIAERKAAVFKPAIGTVRSAKALHDLVWATRGDGTREDLDDVREILRMNCAVRRPIPEFVQG